MRNLRQKIENFDWLNLSKQLDEQGYALTPRLLSPAHCAGLTGLYTSDKTFRSSVVMERHNFGRGEYRYFANPLPPLIAGLREHFYPPLASIANRWAARLKQPERYPPTLNAFLASCTRHQQIKPTPLM
ncbi:MAG: 2OG-Fe(II) oxygenase, partial [Pyrinomonadaceae bacterium]